jgi:hypothetical protein
MFKDFLLVEAIQYNIDNDLPLTECVFRRESDKFYEYFNYLRENQDKYNFTGMDKQLVNSDIGLFGLYEGEEVPLDLPFVEEEKMENPCWDGYVMVGMKTNDKGEKVPNCVPEDSLTEEEKKELNSPKRNSGPGKKFYVYVKNNKGNVIKVTFGDEKGGLSAKINDEEARKSFVARHNCEAKTDKTSPGYWSCRLPYYAKELGLSGGGKFFW